MKALVIYDSIYGNTAEIAKAIGNGIAGEVKVVGVSEVNQQGMESLDLLVVGAPTQAGRPSQAMKDFLDQLSDSITQGVNVAAFDTRLTTRWIKLFGYAAGKIGKNLKKKGGNLLLDPEPFFVTGKEGPLKEGELERAAAWGRQIAGSL
ncbi:MAG: flavodoxin family protein [Chloroflexi bacterium]|mgnify:CR=1 FL=1|jgi:flavodoxin I|nr:flavodoxin family protein [Chloroflexota bacterium]MBT7081177.1 flavodoxin family protein [Chloroflexota bacterium]MBT7290843.1 flavodoxin family protein [Chloroflexota bacterium]